ncbi:hypothetical protein JOJ87_001437 [Rhodococcus ruber]|uniref:phage portal protein n=1 Tax=Rhodococcus ruber TaxID=1830 RepID=UPI001AE475FC|nr:phage portal protein [Rhodococcus ruber]MBP2211093.1 hypothetical protein [Rhodococcus ruber]
MTAFPQVPGLDHTDQNTLDSLVKQWRQKRVRNEIRTEYYRGTNRLKDLGISIPPQLREVETVIGWGTKAVDMLANRCLLEGFVVPGLSTEDLGVDEIWDDNRLTIEAPQAHTSAMTHSVAFLTTTLGDTAAGEPEVLITARSAVTGTGLWDPRRRRLSAALSIVDSDSSGVSELVMYLPDRVLTMRRGARNRWDIREVKHSLGRVPVEPLVFRPNLDRPLGTSRLSRAAMSIIDRAVRTVLRSEVAAEFYAAPQRYVLGADPDMFQGADGQVRTGWESIMGRLLAMGRDENDELPTVGQFPQISMQPHIDQLREAATEFAGVTNLPVSSLGVIQDNPSSAEAMDAATADLVADAEIATMVFGVAWEQAMRTGIQLRDNLTELPPELRKIRAKWSDPSRQTLAAAADTASKVVTAAPSLADTDVLYELLRLSPTQIARVRADQRQSSVRTVLDRIGTIANPTDPAVQALATKTTPAVEDGAPAAPAQE